jgi:hypothetical protein
MLLYTLGHARSFIGACVCMWAACVFDVRSDLTTARGKQVPVILLVLFALLNASFKFMFARFCPFCSCKICFLFKLYHVMMLLLFPARVICLCCLASCYTVCWCNRFAWLGLASAGRVQCDMHLSMLYMFLYCIPFARCAFLPLATQSVGAIDLSCQRKQNAM